MLDSHPIIRNAGVLALVASLGAGAWMVLDMRSQLAAIEDHLGDQARASDQRFEMRANEHWNISQDIGRVLAALALDLAEHTHGCGEG